ncbi:hypothetical protein H696_02969 [Fonticula alba]|uniref:Phosphomannomutase/phosphoglucomutase n=1 Tax=Fonticula alba TaxID=691883 RepID=A0A058ZB11_FONAL|nr:hypothetical protein H696_02969 [Fonticula alba]KCV70612.1 hypothetical protein H696_02969 [Fonticula alba]|eukprot:XP_009495128.1 hypothetical protein H696_02969 [Fonticula alba]
MRSSGSRLCTQISIGQFELASEPLPAIWTRLPNGSDIRGVAFDPAATDNSKANLTQLTVSRIGAAFVDFLARNATDESGVTVALGHDGRLSAEFMIDNVSRGIMQAGATRVVSFGLASTPAMFMSTITEGHKYTGAIMLTASHLPSERNGLKFFTKDGGLESADIKWIIARAAFLAEQDAEYPKANIDTVDFMSVYAGILVEKIRSATGKQCVSLNALEGLHLIVDAGNGAGGFFVDKVLKPLGAKTDGSQFLDSDGTFPNHPPNPEDKQAMAMARDALLAARADMCIVFDTDVDRAGIVDASGREINRDRLIALLSAIVLRETPGVEIVTDSVTSDGLASFIAAKGGRHHRFKRGYRNVINEAQKRGSPFAIETSGHGALQENHYLDDGAYLVVKILIELAVNGLESITSLLSDLQEPVEEEEFRLKIAAEDFKTVGAGVLAHLNAVLDSPSRAAELGWSRVTPNHEGVRVAVRFPEDESTGWFLIRMSLHDPVMPLNVQSNSRVGGVRAITQAFLTFLRSDPSVCASLDLTGLEAFIAQE